MQVTQAVYRVHLLVCRTDDPMLKRDGIRGDFTKGIALRLPYSSLVHSRKRILQEK